MLKSQSGYCPSVLAPRSGRREPQGRRSVWPQVVWGSEAGGLTQPQAALREHTPGSHPLLHSPFLPKTPRVPAPHAPGPIYWACTSVEAARARGVRPPGIGELEVGCRREQRPLECGCCDCRPTLGHPTLRLSPPLHGQGPPSAPSPPGGRHRLWLRGLLPGDNGPPSGRWLPTALVTFPVFLAPPPL